MCVAYNSFAKATNVTPSLINELVVWQLILEVLVNL
jgi:hypothetical protein